MKMDLFDKAIELSLAILFLSIAGFAAALMFAAAVTILKNL